MKGDTSAGRFLFPEWTNALRPAVALALVAVPVYVVALVWLGASPKTMAAGYQPEQPVPYSHALHAGEMGINCRYCHNTVEIAAKASIPPTQTCMNCHAKVRAASDKLTPIRESYATGMPVPWVRVHDLAQYVYFNHSAHVVRGVGCVECHGRVDKMDVVKQIAPLSMGWCLDCHRDPNAHLRPAEAATKMDWVAPEEPAVYGRRLREASKINPPTDCYACHR